MFKFIFLTIWNILISTLVCLVIIKFLLHSAVQHEFNNFDLYIKEVLLCNCNSEVFFSTDTLTTKLVIEQSHAHTFVNVIKDIKEEMICI